MLRSAVVIFMLLAAFSSSNVGAQDSGFGLGVILGEPTGISFKNWVGSRTSIDGGIAWSFSNNNSFHLHMDYLVHNFNVFKAKKGKLALYYGIGGRIKTEKSRFGVRIPVGINYIFGDAPLDIFFELAPVLDLVPSTEFGLTGGIGIRYYF
jgi:hypothetical protein